VSAAFQFLTIAPPVVRRLFLPAEIGHAVAYFPLVGLALGGLLVGLHWALALVLPPAVVAGLILTAWVLLTGALHLDGFLDTCDGLFGGFTPEARLRILRDERVGAYAVTGGVLLLLLKYATIAASANVAVALALAPTLGRWAIALAVVFFPYARPEGLGRDMKAHSGWGQAAVATAIALVAAWFVAAWPGLLVALLAAIVMLGGARLTLARIPGLTGDIYGAICELAELAVLLLFAVR
jgi:adenosylcobinamide-GDP ribazoletransferase